MHTNIGGGYADQEIADMTLAWMIQCTCPWIEFSEDYLTSIIKNGGDYSKEWAAGKIYNSATGMMMLSSGGPRTPGEYGDGTFEALHVSVRCRMHVVPGWKSAALKGWEWDEQKCLWTKGTLELPESTLGHMERHLAGDDIVMKLLGEARMEDVEAGYSQRTNGAGHS